MAYPGVMDTVALAAAAATTTSIGLLSNIIGPAWPPVLLAKETSSIDAISGRLTLGLGVGIRNGEPVGGGPNPAVTPGARQIPLILGGAAPAAFERAARWGIGYIGASMPALMIAPHFEATRTAWAKAGREETPRLVAIAYFALGDGYRARRTSGLITASRAMR
jgi:alkanesulfonate monooxygenase SsuD/methylene tetrahydromethanopterin reductase-like flavin-dependent oxidoreductase (luciferase family)